MGGAGMLTNTFNKAAVSIRKESSTNSAGAGTQAIETRNDEVIEEEKEQEEAAVQNENRKRALSEKMIKKNSDGFN
jgi:hypothetical protein